MVTWMEHEKHGRHPAIGQEVESLKNQGWKIYVKHKNADDKVIPSAVTETPTVMKRGRPAKAK